MIQALKRLDRRWIFLSVLAVAVFFVIVPVPMPITPGAPVRALYRAVDAVPDGATVLLGFDYEPGSEIELTPAAIATMRHLWRKNIHLIGISLWPAGSSEARMQFRRVADEMAKEGHPKKYGVDYVNLGYKSGNAAAIRALASGFSSTFPSDIDGRPVSTLPIMQHVNHFSDIALLITYSVGDPGIKQYVQILGTYGVKIGGAVTAVNAPEMSPFMASGQLVGLLGGLRGAADYETLMNLPGEATQGMNVQSFVHLLIAFFIVLSNVVYFAEGKRWQAAR